MRFLYRLRTQLILSHLIAIACTLVAMVGAVVLIVGGWFTSQQASLSEPTQAARVVARSCGSARWGSSGSAWMSGFGSAPGPDRTPHR